MCFESLGSSWCLLELCEVYIEDESWRCEVGSTVNESMSQILRSPLP